MVPARRVRLFRNGRNQAVRIPRELELPGQEALIRREGDRLIIEPAETLSLLELVSSWTDLDDALPELQDPTPESIDL